MREALDELTSGRYLVEEKMSRWGIGPIFAALSIGYSIVMLLITWLFYPIFQIRVVPYNVLVIPGIVLIVIGIPFVSFYGVTVMRAYNADRLVTSGVFGCCRHPLYAAWTVFLVPGIVLMADSWIVLTTPIFMFAVLRILVKKEEVYLENAFGSEYLDYKKTVPCILPYGWLKKGV